MTIRKKPSKAQLFDLHHPPKPKKLPVKGDVADTVDNYLLTTVGDSFCGYLYEPKAKIRIYEVLKK